MNLEGTRRTTERTRKVPQSPATYKVMLEWLKGKEGTDVIEIKEGHPVHIGRDPSADISINDPNLSRLHCSISVIAGVFFIEDLNSRNGTYVEKKRVNRAPLESGNQVWIGDCSFKFFLAPVEEEVSEPSLEIRKHYRAHGEVISTIIDKAEYQKQPARIREKLATLFQIGSVLSAETSLTRISGAILDAVMDVFKPERAFLLLQDGAKQTPQVVASRTKRDDPSFSQTIVGETCRSGASILTINAMGDERFRGSRSIVAQQIRSVMCVPVQTQKSTIGAIYVDSRRERRDFTEEDLELLAAVGQLAGVAVERAKLTENLQLLFLDTVRALVATIDAIDHYTKGHSQRVSTIAATICKELPEHASEARTVQLAGLLHDIGKIVATNVLRKEGPLSDTDKELIRRHPVEGAVILNNIRNMKEVATAVLHHHERWDGGGYPAGLAGEEIPFASRVLAVADSFDAMTSERPYRSALSLEEAAKEIESKSGSQYDPRVVEGFLKALREGKIRTDTPPLSDSIADGFVLKLE